mgnify:CR=1 FL=1
MPKSIEAEKSKKTWTPAHQKSRKHRKKLPMLQASKNIPGLKPHHHYIFIHRFLSEPHFRPSNLETNTVNE